MGACFGKQGSGVSRISPLSLKQRERLLVEFKDISAELVPERMIARTIDAILRLLPIERASVFIVDRAGGVLRTFNEVHGQGERPVSKTITIPIDKGIAGSVVGSAKVVIVDDAQGDSRFDSSVDRETGFHTRNLISVPVKLALQSGDGDTRRASSAGEDPEAKVEVVAVLQALNHASGHFSKHDVSVLEFIAMLLAGVLARSALIDEAVREKNKARALLKVAESVNSADTSKVKALRVMQAVLLGVDCERAAFVLVDEVHSEQVLFTLDSEAAGLRFPTSAGVTGAVIASADPIVIADAYADARFNKEADAATGFVTRDLVAVPVLRHGSGDAHGAGRRVIAVIEAVNSRRGALDEEVVELLQTIALQVADRLIPGLIQDMVEASSQDHGLDDSEVEKMRAMLSAEFATPKPSKALKRNATQGTLRKAAAAAEQPKQAMPSMLALRSTAAGKSKFAKAIGKALMKESTKPAPPEVVMTERPGQPPATDVTAPAAASVRRPSVTSWSLGGAFAPSKTMPSLPVLSVNELFTRPRGMSEDELISWDLDILAFDATELMQLTAAVFKQSGVLDTFGIPPESLAHFIAAIGGRYHPNPYHNFNHGVHVLLGSWLLARDELRYHNVEPLEPLHILALLVAAVGHDVDHPGLNNAFLCASNDTLAMRYNDLSVLENHHAATTFEILAEKRCNMLATITPEQRKEVSSTCTHLNAHTR